MESDSSNVVISSGYSNEDNSMAHRLNSQVAELQLSQVGRFDPSRVSAALDDDPPTEISETNMTTLLACEENEIMEDADSRDEESWASLKDLITETTNATPHFPDLSDYANGDENGIPEALSPTTMIYSHENTQDLSLNSDSSPTGGSPFNMLGTSAGVLNNMYDMDEVATMSKRYGVFPFIKKTADMCFHNQQLSHLLGKHFTGPLPQLTDPTGTDQIADITMTLAPKKNITLVLDIDGTLIHSSMSADGADFSFPMLREEKAYTVYVKKRPYVDAFLEKVAQMFEIAVFTASLSSYADQLLDILDPENRLISRRYYRDSCLVVDGSYLKDLTIIEADLAKVAIIDNTPEVFQLQVHNGIPINTWSSDPYDVSLPALIPFLETLAVTEDVRPIIANKFAD
uniref:Uncharacterized protein n=1 Tax=Avena sativa TaxID=4498 RepID=A0ACD5T7A6_AVESA